MAAHVLEAADFWKLRTLCAEQDRYAQQAILARDALVAAQRKQQACVATLAARYGFDAQAPSFTLDDDTLTLTVPDTETG